MDITIIKHKKRTSEPFNEEKLHRSIYLTCLGLHSPDGIANDTATTACNALTAWLSNKSEVTSSDIRRQVVSILSKLHPDAAYIYQHHKRIM